MQKFNIYITLVLIMLSLSGCFSSGSQIPFQDNGGSSGSEGGQQTLPSTNNVALMNTANAGRIFGQVESAHFFGYVVLGPSSVQGMTSDQGVEMMDPMMRISRDFVDFTFSQQ